MNFNPIDKQRIISMVPPTTDCLLASTGTYVSFKNVHKGYLVVHLNAFSTATVATAPYQASDVSGTGKKVFSTANPLNIWVSSSQDAVPVKQTASYVNYTFSTSTGASGHSKMVCYEIDPACMDLANGFDCCSIQITSTTSICNWSSFMLADMRYGVAEAYSFSSN
jgi:hypothetical protein